MDRSKWFIKWFRSDFHNYSDASIVVKETTIIKGTNSNNRAHKKLIFRNNSTLR